MRSTFGISSLPGREEVHIYSYNPDSETPPITCVYPFTEKERSDIARILNRHRFTWHRSYYEPFLQTIHMVEIYDGETLQINVRYDGKEKRVFCNNKIPSGLRKMCEDIISYCESTKSPTRPNIPGQTNRPGMFTQ